MEVHEEPSKSQTVAGTSDSSSGTNYINLSYTEKAKHHGQGFVYHPKLRTSRTGKRIPFSDDTWNLEWSSGIYKLNGRLKYNKITIRSTGQQARDLLNIIVQVPYRTLAEAYDAIEPFIEYRGVPKSGAIARYAKQYIPAVPTGYQLQRRELIILDYYRIKLLDTIAKLCGELGNYECEGNGVGVETATLRP